LKKAQDLAKEVDDDIKKLGFLEMAKEAKSLASNVGNITDFVAKSKALAQSIGQAGKDLVEVVNEYEKNQASINEIGKKAGDQKLTSPNAIFWAFYPGKKLASPAALIEDRKLADSKRFGFPAPAK